ncbi:MAG: four helix bundle protein, partial [Deltaproteobacteria bacterium]|nr:four helix bundle protein [Deltaproteobacteria bacterium]
MHWRELKVWQKAHNLVLKCYRVTVTFPKTEVYGLVDQIKRASYSVPSNIVEGQSRNTTMGGIHFAPPSAILPVWERRHPSTPLVELTTPALWKNFS